MTLIFFSSIINFLKEIYIKKYEFTDFEQNYIKLLGDNIQKKYKWLIENISNDISDYLDFIVIQHSVNNLMIECNEIMINEIELKILSKLFFNFLIDKK